MDPILDFLTRSVAVRQDGRVGLDGLLLVTYPPLVASAIEMNYPIDYGTKNDIVSHCIMELLSKKTLNTRNLLRMTNTLAAKESKKPLNRYVVLSHISVVFPISVVNIRYDKCHISIRRSFPTGFSRGEIKETIIGYYGNEASPCSYSVAKITVRALNPYDAATKGLYILNTLRGIWNFTLKYNWAPINQPFVFPLNDIVLGPVHTVHLASGALATKDIWYEPNYREHRNAINIGNKYKELRNSEYKIRNTLNHMNTNDKNTMKYIFGLYSVALDEWNWDVVYLNLWNMLENILKKEGERKINIGRRASFIHKNAMLAEQNINILKCHRNSMLHDINGERASWAHIYYLKKYIDSLILFIVNNVRRFKTIDNIIELFSLPTDIDKLMNDIKLIKKAYRKRGGLVKL